MKRVKANTHLTLEARMVIEENLNDGNNISKIARDLHRDRSNISSEIQRNKTMYKPNSYGNTSTCIHKDVCTLRKYGCDESCKKYEMEICDKLKTSPHICNSCKSKACRKVKFYYRAKEAERQYSKRLINSRKSLHYTEVELNILNNDFYCLVLVNKSIYHSLEVINKMGYHFKLKSIYRQIKDGSLRLRTLDLPRANITKNKQPKDKTYKRNIEGHTYEDYQAKICNNPNIIEWQMDCVQGIQGKNESVFLTLQIVKIKFLFVFIIKAQTQDAVAEKLKNFCGILNTDSTNKLIELLLTDNGHEFIDLDRLTEILNINDIYYCHPYSSCEKGSIENNHKLIRRIIPQGISLNIYNEDDIKLLCSNINSLYRDELGGKCPFDLVHKYISKKTMEIIGYKKIDAEDVMLIPELLGNKNVMNIKKYLSSKEINNANVLFIEDEDIKATISKKILKFKLK